MTAKNLEIEKLRAVAIIFVIIWHSCDLLFDVFGVSRSSYATWTGVDLFFCISGYVITKSLVGSLGATRLRVYLGGFYVKRIFRITPSAIVCVGVSLAVAFFARRHFGRGFFDDTRADALPALLNYANFAFFYKVRNHGGTMLGIFWSLSLEEQFYLVIPVVVWLFRRRLKLLSLVLVPLALLQFFHHREPWQVLSWSLRTDGLIYGVVIALAEREYPAVFQAIGRKAASVRPVIAILACGLLFALAVVASDMGRRFTELSTSWAAVIGAALVFGAALDRGLILGGSGRCSRILVWFGSRSYGLYLFHNLALVLAKGFNAAVLHVTLAASNPAYYAFILASLAFMCACCEANYRLIEVPLRNMGRRISDRRFAPV